MITECVAQLVEHWTFNPQVLGSIPNTFKFLMINNIFFLLTVNSALYVTACLGLFSNRQNILVTIMTLEILILAANLNLIAFSVLFDDIFGQIAVLFILTVSAAESSVGLAILTYNFRLIGNIGVKKIKFF